MGSFSLRLKQSKQFQTIPHIIFTVLMIIHIHTLSTNYRQIILKVSLLTKAQQEYLESTDTA